METKHTPWQFRTDCLRDKDGAELQAYVEVLDANGARVYFNIIDDTDDEAISVARLIASAPDLLSALGRAQDALSAVEENRFDLDMAEIQIALSIASAAIAKATGAA